MTEHATVIEIHGQKVTLGCIASACASCQASGACSVKESRYEALNKKDLALSPGDKVQVYLPPAKTIGAAFGVMIFPLLLFIAGYLAGSRVLGINSEGVNVLIGLGGLAAGFGVNLVFSAILKKSSYPLITAKE
ncbi:MAG: SoxR reducing system RseC family protein [Spirochaetales bacterium]|nr:SoxR reducing system RseC family protein [Spirochaetales bacterium]